MRAHLLNAFLAVVFSVLIWSAVGAQLSETTTVDVDYIIQVPPDVTVTYLGKHAAGELKIPIKVEVRGPREVIGRLAPGDVQARRTFSHENTFLREALAAGGTRTIELGSSDVFVMRPNVELVSARPSPLEVAFSQVDDWETRLLSPQLLGAPAPGFRVASIDVRPQRVWVRGPASLRDRQPGPYEVEAVDVTGERVPAGKRSIDLSLPRAVRTPLGVTCDTKVQVVVTIVPEPEVRELLFPVKVLLSAQRGGAGAAAVEPLAVSVEPRPPVQEWSWPIPLRGAAADLDALGQRLDQDRRSPGSVRSLPVAYVRFDGVHNLPAGTVDDLDVLVVGLPEGISVEVGSLRKFPIRTRAQ
ncbi:MAG: hypothetical protein M9894_10870 [Planctomycetes bacterium]|nr:hypothetical protein [Planctomycetota bacterium]